MAPQTQELTAHCLRCDAPLAPRARKCPRCGAQTPVGKARQGGLFALFLGVPIAIGFLGAGWYVNGGNFTWLTALHPVDKIDCAAARSENEAMKAFNDGAGKIRLMKLVALTDVKEVSRTRDAVQCSATGHLDGGAERPVGYTFSAEDQQISLKVDVR